MTWVVKICGDSTALISSEYECPIHGRFEVTVRRDELPDELPCREEVEHYDGRFRSIREYCGMTSPWRFPSPMTRVQRVYAARRGKDPERPPNCLDWQALAYDEKPPEEVMATERKKDWETIRGMVKGALR